MVNALKNFFSQNHLVKAAYLLWMVKGNVASYLLILDFDGTQQTIFSKITNLCHPFLEGKLLDMLPINTSFAKNESNAADKIIARKIRQFVDEGNVSAAKELLKENLFEDKYSLEYEVIFYEQKEEAITH